jgi:hypothetical protein
MAQYRFREGKSDRMTFAYFKSMSLSTDPTSIRANHTDQTIYRLRTVTTIIDLPLFNSMVDSHLHWDLHDDLRKAVYMDF